MEHVLQPALLSSPPVQRITAEQFHKLKRSRAILNAAFNIEEIFDLLVGNFLEMECSALGIAANAVVRRLSEYRELFEIRAELNRRMVNFLTAARMFVDQLPRQAKGCEVDPVRVKNGLRAEYDGHFEYRFMEALRNHVQHSGVAVHKVGIGSQGLPRGQRLFDDHYLTVEWQPGLLEHRSDFKATVLRECPDQVDLLAYARRYLESLSNVQTQVRASAATCVSDARDATRAAIEKYAVFSTASSLGLEAKALSAGDLQTVERVPVFLDWDDVRLKLASRNDSMANLSARRVASFPARSSL